MARSARDFYNSLLLVAITIIVVPWAAFAWEASTGLTVATRRSLGQNSSAEHVSSTRRAAIAATIFAAPVAAFCLLARPKE